MRFVNLANELDWSWLDEELSENYSNEGWPSIPARTIGGMLLLKQMFNESDESVLRRWVENHYWQYFTGETYFQHKPPFDPTDFVYFRKQVAEKGMEKVFSLTVRFHGGSEVEEDDLVDTTVQEKNITYPKLALKIINYCWSYAESEGIQLRQSYRFVLKGLHMKCFNATHSKRRKAARKAQRKIRTTAGRLIRDMRRKMSPQALDYHGSSLSLFVDVLNQKRGDKNKRYNLNDPAVWCIAKGKAHKKYELGCKVSVERGAESGVILGMKSFTGNPYDGHTLEASLTQVQRTKKDTGGNRLQRAVGDRGYRGSRQVGTTAILIPRRGNKNQTYYEKQK